MRKHEVSELQIEFGVDVHYVTTNDERAGTAAFDALLIQQAGTCHCVGDAVAVIDGAELLASNNLSTPRIVVLQFAVLGNEELLEGMGLAVGFADSPHSIEPIVCKPGDRIAYMPG